MKTKLDRLNELLKNPELKIPNMYQTVKPNGQSWNWVRKNMRKSPAACAELKELLAHELGHLASTSYIEVAG